jgi:hypothetical protein
LCSNPELHNGGDGVCVPLGTFRRTVAATLGSPRLFPYLLWLGASRCRRRPTDASLSASVRKLPC